MKRTAGWWNVSYLVLVCHKFVQCKFWLVRHFIVVLKTVKKSKNTHKTCEEQCTESMLTNKNTEIVYDDISESTLKTKTRSLDHNAAELEQ